MNQRESVQEDKRGRSNKRINEAPTEEKLNNLQPGIYSPCTMKLSGGKRKPESCTERVYKLLGKLSYDDTYKHIYIQESGSKQKGGSSHCGSVG